MVSLKEKLAVLTTGLGLISAAQKLLDVSDIQMLGAGVAVLAIGAFLAGLAVHWIVHQSVQEALREREDS